MTFVTCDMTCVTSDLLEDADEVRPGAQVGHVQHVCEGGEHLHLVQNLEIQNKNPTVYFGGQ